MKQRLKMAPLVYGVSAGVILFLLGMDGRAADSFLPTTVPDLSSLVGAHGDALAHVTSDKEAVDLFVSTLGPALQLPDVTRILAAKNLPPRMAKELLVPDVTAATIRLVGALAAWRQTTTAPNDGRPPETVEALQASPAHREWLSQQRVPPSESASLHVAFQEWDRLRNWKDRVRLLRGQGRLCGTWQWAVHNHQQHHQEQKLSLLFPPPGVNSSGIAGLVETVVLGDNVYLRWEIDGRVQEDSLQFTKEGQRLEGTFVNSQGGWGSISGKRTANCTP